MAKDLKYYLSLPWQFEITKQPDGKYSARVKGIMCYSNGKTLEEAAKNIKEALRFHIESCLQDNLPVEPIDEERASGRIAIRTSKAIHLKLLHIAHEQDVSVSHLINDAIVRYYG